MTFLVSVIVPTYNRARLLVETLDSVKNQTFSDWECIIIDDGTKEGTREVVERFSHMDSRFRYYKKPVDYPNGAASARNFGFIRSNGKYIQWLDDDDLISSNKLEKQVNTLESLNDDLVFTSCSWDLYWPGKTLELKNMNDSNMLLDAKSFFVVSRKTQSFLPIHSFLMSRILVDKAGGWNKDLTVNDDAEFLSRVLLQSKGFINTNDCYVLYREHGDNRLSKKINQEHLQKLILSFHLMYNHLSKKGIFETRYFKWKMINIFHQFWSSDKVQLQKHSNFFYKIGIDLRFAPFYTMKYSIYKAIYPLYKKILKK